MGRQKGAAKKRLELTQFREDSAALAELEREATAREVSVQPHQLLCALYPCTAVLKPRLFCAILSSV